MDKTDIRIPTDEELTAYMEESAVSANGAYEQSPVVLMVDDAAIGTLGNFSASIGKAKSKKTFNVTAIAASALKNGTVLKYRSSFPEDKRTVLYIDTEQGRHHCQKVLKRILRLAGLPEDKNPDNLIMLALRKYAPPIRLAIVEQAIGTIPNLGLVIIDGIRDFLYDINSPSEATDIISRFMQWTDDRQIHIHTILHQNKNDENARGHIGTELNNKAETVMQVEVDKMDRTVSVVEAIHIRDRDEATDIISRFMQWTDDRQIHIHTILHQNKNDENARGHIGTELNNKAETVMQVEVDKMDRTVSVVEAIHIRDREFEPFAFRINDEVLPELLESYQPQEKKIGRPAKEPFDPYKEISESVHRAALDAAFTNVCITSYDDYLERLKEGYALQDIKLGHNKAVKVATFLSNKRMVIKEGKEYKINPDSHY